MGKYQSVDWKLFGLEAATAVLFYAGMRHYKVEGLQKATGYVAISALAQTFSPKVQDKAGLPTPWNLLLDLTSLGSLTYAMKLAKLNRNWRIGLFSSLVAVQGTASHVLFQSTIFHELKECSSFEKVDALTQWLEDHQDQLSENDQVQFQRGLCHAALPVCAKNKEYGRFDRILNLYQPLINQLQSEEKALAYIDLIELFQSYQSFNTNWLPFEGLIPDKTDSWKAWLCTRGVYIEMSWKILTMTPDSEVEDCKDLKKLYQSDECKMSIEHRIELFLGLEGRISEENYNHTLTPYAFLKDNLNALNPKEKAQAWIQLALDLNESRISELARQEIKDDILPSLKLEGLSPRERCHFLKAKILYAFYFDEDPSKESQQYLKAAEKLTGIDKASAMTEYAELFQGKIESDQTFQEFIPVHGLSEEEKVKLQGWLDSVLGRFCALNFKVCNMKPENHETVYQDLCDFINDDQVEDKIKIACLAYFSDKIGQESPLWMKAHIWRGGLQDPRVQDSETLKHMVYASPLFKNFPENGKRMFTEQCVPKGVPSFGQAIGNRASMEVNAKLTYYDLMLSFGFDSGFRASLTDRIAAIGTAWERCQWRMRLYTIEKKHGCLPEGLDLATPDGLTPQQVQTYENWRASFKGTT